MLYEDCYEFFAAMRRKPRGQRGSCNFEIKGTEAPALIEYGKANFVGDWAFREIDNGVSYCVYCNDKGDRLLMLLGFSEHVHCDYGINNGKNWFPT